jgi:hypothetical protein
VGSTLSGYLFQRDAVSVPDRHPPPRGSTVYLTALSAGHTVPLENWYGRVHSVFRHACNFCLANGALITLLARELGDIPQGVRLKTRPGFTFVDAHLQAGQEVVCRSGVIRVKGTPLQIDLRPVHIWRSDLTTMQVNMTDPWTQTAWEVAWQELLTRHPPEGLATLATSFSPLTSDFAAPQHASPLSRRAYPAMRALVSATRRLDLVTAAPAVGSLLGLGPGLTPSGDDFLVGFIAGLWSTTGQHAQRRMFVSGLGTLLAGGAQRTTDISSSYLGHAAEGRVSDALVSLVRALGHECKSERVRQATQNALHIGSTSGADGVMGLLIGLKTWQPDDQGSQASRQGTET